VSFRTRLVLAAAYLLAAVVVALEVPLALNVDRRADSEFQSGVLGNAAILAARSSDLVANANTSAANRERTLARLRALVEDTTTSADERIVVADVRGRVLADSDRLAAPGTLYATAERPEFGVALFAGRIDFRRRSSESLGEELLLVTVPVVDRQRVVGAIRVSAATGTVEASVRESWLRLALIGLAVIAAGLGLAWILAGSLARPLERLRAAASALGRGDLDARAPAEGPTELRAVARTFNDMARALAANLSAQRDFLANASHQLRTPLTGLKLRLEALQEEKGPVAEQAAKAAAEVDRLSALVSDLLELARASSVESTGRTVDLAGAAREAVLRWAEPAERAGKAVRLARADGASVWADSADLAHVLDNLIENSLRYCPPGTGVAVEAVAENSRGKLVVADDGPGIPAEEQARVFERFYRGARGRQAGAGTGLGLAIVAELAGRWDGQVRLLDGPGTRVEACFPLSPTDS
jgi:two-component system, OmpR family, sensor kinase